MTPSAGWTVRWVRSSHTRRSRPRSLRSNASSPTASRRPSGCSLAAVLSELCALAGWEALDRYAIREAWEHHERAKQAAREAESPTLLAHATAQQAFVLVDIGEIESAVEQLGQARALVQRTAPALLRAWLAAAHGEGLAAWKRRDDALRAFDMSDRLRPTDPVDPTMPFLFLEGVHLDRWRGHALAKLGDSEAIGVLTNAIDRTRPHIHARGDHTTCRSCAGPGT